MATKPKKALKVGDGKDRGGRPVVADQARRDTLVRLLVTTAEHDEVRNAASYVGMPVSTWIRVIVLERARAVAAEKEAARSRDE